MIKFNKDLLKDLEKEQDISVGWETVNEFNREENVKKRENSWLDKFNKTKKIKTEKDDKNI